MVVPLVGARNEKQLKDNLGAAEVTLTDEQMTRLDDASRPDLGFPHSFLGLDGEAAQYVYGKTGSRLDAHRGELTK